MKRLARPKYGLPDYLDGFRIYPIRQSHGYNYAGHNHNFVELHYCESGMGSIQVGTKCIPLMPGVVTLLFGPIHHRVFCPVHTVYRRIVLHFPPALAITGLGINLLEAMSFLPTRSNPCLQFVVNPGKDERELQTLLDQMYDLSVKWSPRSPYDVALILGKLATLIGNLTRHVPDQPGQQPIQPHEELLVIRVEELVNSWVQNEYHTIPQIPTISALFNVSPGHLRRVFTKVRRRSLGEYLLVKRLSMAEKHLRAGATVMEASTYSYFRNLGNFSRTFKNYMGVSPSVYQSWLNGSYGIGAE